MAAIYSNGGNRWNILGFNFTKRDALSSVYKISMLMADACFRLIVQRLSSRKGKEKCLIVRGKFTYLSALYQGTVGKALLILIYLIFCYLL